MTRVPCRSTAVRGMRARQTFPKINMRKHKIILESITQEKKKLRSALSFEAKPPAGYTFIPAGNPEFTNGCKELCRKHGFKIYTVSTTPHQGAHDLSQQVHRIGYHFPSTVVATICMERGLFLSSSGKVVAYQNRVPGQTQGNKAATSEQSQATIDTEARDAIKDLFPNIPAKDLKQIVKTAFRKGKKRVGTAVELPLARRAQLAVVAHIRHMYTEYDRLLKMTSFQEARAAVEEPCLAKLVNWRGDDENGATVLEDVFREVIVISDDEDDDQIVEDTAFQPPYDDRRAMAGAAPSHSVAREAFSDYENARERYSMHPAGVDRANGHGPSTPHYVPVERSSQRLERRNNDHRGFRRYEAWDRARTRYSNAVNGSSFVHAAPEPEQRYPPSFSRVESQPSLLDAGTQRIQLPPTQDPVVRTRTTDHVRREIITEYPERISTHPSMMGPSELKAPVSCPGNKFKYLWARNDANAAVKQGYYNPSNQKPAAPAFERTHYVYQQSPTPAHIPRENQLQARRSYPPAREVRYSIAHQEHHPHEQDPAIEHRDHPILQSIESPLVPASRPERLEEYEARRQSPAMVPRQPVARNVRFVDAGPTPQPEMPMQQSRQQPPPPARALHRTDTGFSRAMDPWQRSDVHPSLYQRERSSPGASHAQTQQQQPLKHGQTLGRVYAGPTIGGDRHSHHLVEHRTRSQPIANQEDPRRATLRYPYPNSPTLILRPRHTQPVAYHDIPTTDAGNRLPQVRVYDRCPEPQYLTPIESSRSLDKRYPDAANDPYRSPAPYPSAVSAFRSYRSPPPAMRTLDPTPATSHANRYIESPQYTEEQYVPQPRLIFRHPPQ